ncbi:MAG: hypothetical protein AB1422_15865 [bacterium]
MSPGSCPFPLKIGVRGSDLRVKEFFYSRVPSPESRAPSPEPRAPSPESRAPIISLLF